MWKIRSKIYPIAKCPVGSEVSSPDLNRGAINFGQGSIETLAPRSYTLFRFWSRCTEYLTLSKTRQSGKIAYSFDSNASFLDHSYFSNEIVAKYFDPNIDGYSGKICDFMEDSGTAFYIRPFEPKHISKQSPLFKKLFLHFCRTLWDREAVEMFYFPQMFKYSYFFIRFVVQTAVNSPVHEFLRTILTEIISSLAFYFLSGAPNILILLQQILAYSLIKVCSTI